MSWVCIRVRVFLAFFYFCSSVRALVGHHCQQMKSVNGFRKSSVRRQEIASDLQKLMEKLWVGGLHRQKLLCFAFLHLFFLAVRFKKGLFLWWKQPFLWIVFVVETTISLDSFCGPNVKWNQVCENCDIFPLHLRLAV